MQAQDLTDKQLRETIQEIQRKRDDYAQTYKLLIALARERGMSWGEMSRLTGVKNRSSMMRLVRRVQEAESKAQAG